MNKMAFFITVLAGLSTLLGICVIWIKGELEKIVGCSLGFAAGVMLFVSIFDLLPSSLYYFQSSFMQGFHILFCILFFVVGTVLSVYINIRINSKINDSSHLYRIGLLSMIAIILHNIPEGIITYLTTAIDYRTGVFLAFSIAAHNIPEGICIAAPIYYATRSKKQALMAVFISSLSEPIGALIAFLFFQDNMSNMFIAILLSTVSGIMVAFAITEILPEAIKNSKKHAFLYLALGFIVILISHLLF